ncbi:Nucleotide-binding universal stress protein, UspA family [Micromonospora phaseoli]|uniref:Nucleotide-binding universal stress protein, UspA family n=1 Tax=Micromonospora phaseoli TaxID=1144548 RepID=A0A1H6SZV3_9ACTN|nr:universal stress protein [Micromonospora phaseoli]PZW04173.1 nucleotide-binding universal stress UspA family protein [Micromonospora phaseoli]GIJ79359.1 universal stress protein [Micromonospora phaseoli]SEI73373.1 Nucleotide-binding universal stress protein, UspA family [Micromonospora phaseoli]
MASNTGAPVVVGVDGSEIALHAVRAAAREAAYRHRPLRIVHAFIWPLMGVPLGPAPGAPAEGGLRNQAERCVTEAVAEAGKVAPEVPVTGVVVDGAATAVLLAEARDAALIVLGNRGLGGFAGLLLGSVAVQVSAHADSPVLVVRDESRADGPVVVGVDGSELSREAVGFAFEQAAWRGAELVAVHAWLYPTPVGPGDILPLVYDLDAFREEEERTLAESVAGWSERYPEVTVRRRLVRGSPARALVEESRNAQLVVLGARGRGALGGLLLGSVSHAVLHHAHSPLAIVRKVGTVTRS